MGKQPSAPTDSRIFDLTVPVGAKEEARRQRILEAMIESCAEKAYATTTIADIVGRAGISRTTFYKRFASKRACFDAALASCMAELEAAAAAARARSESPSDAVREAGASMLGLMASKPALAQLVVGDAVSVEPAIVERYRSLLIRALEGLWYEAGDDPGGPRAASPALAFGRVQALILNQIAAGRTGQLPALLPEIVYISLLPFAGHAEAMRQAELAAADARAGSK